MFRYIMKRVGLIVLTLFITLSIAFFMIRLMPDSNVLEDPTIPPETIQRLKEKYGYDKPLHTQYFIWFQNILPHFEDVIVTISDAEDVTSPYYGMEVGAVVGREFVLTDWGDSLKLQVGTPVFDYISERIPISMLLNILSLFISIPLGIFFGTLSALRKNKLTDHTISISIIFFISVPSFVLASLMQYFLGGQLGWFPYVFDSNIPLALNYFFSGQGLPYFTEVSGVFHLVNAESIDVATGAYVSAADIIFWPAYIEMFKSIVMPVLALSFGSIAGLARVTRAELTEVITSDFMMLAKSKGLTRMQATLRHAFRNSMIPLVGMIIAMFVGILGGSLIIENIFSINGVGSISFKAINAKDFNVFLASMAFYSSISLFTVLVVDILYGVVDPRIRLGGIRG